MNVQCRLDLMKQYEDIELAISELCEEEGEEYPSEIHKMITDWIGDLAIGLQKDELRNRNYAYARRR